MQTNHKSPHLFLAKKYWANHLKDGDVAVDATCGNGHDTLYLSHLLPNGYLYALDIQSDAISNAQTLLKNHLSEERMNRIHIFQQSHDKWEKIRFPIKPRLIVYNLGYLPGGNKKITTETSTTLQSIAKGMQILSCDGAMSITCYPGHEEGSREEKAILDFCTTIASDKWLICHHRFLNRPKAPSFLWMQSLTTPDP